MPDSQLTPGQVQLLRRMWRDKQAGKTEDLRPFKRVERLAWAFGILFLLVAAGAALAKLPPLVLWVLGFAAGISSAIVGMMRSRQETWPLVNRILDWNKVKQLAEAEEK